MNQNNYIFLKRIIDLINSFKKKKFLIHLSSAAVYGKYFHKKNFKISINTPPHPISLYAITKLKADSYLINNSFKYNFVILRPSQVIGKKMKAAGFINLIKFIKLRLFFFINNFESIRNYVMVDDLCKIIFYFCINKKSINNKIYIVSRFSKLINIFNYIKQKSNIKFFPTIVLPKILVLNILNIISFFKKNFVVNKDIIEGLSTSTIINSNVNKIVNIKFKSIYPYLNYLLK